jgi:hypothetical protein
MKKITFSSLVSLAVAVLLLSSCGGLDKMADKAKEINYTVTPNPLEMHGGKVSFSVKGTIPAKYFDKKALLVVTPALKYENGETLFKTKTLQGEKYEDNNEVISWKEGGSFSYTDTVDYVDDMRITDLELRAKASKGGEEADLITVKIADGIIVTPLLVTQGLGVDGGGKAKFIDIPFKMDAKIEDLESAVILYAIQQSNIRGSELKKEDVQKVIELLTSTTDESDNELVNVEIASYASPDGPEDLNAKLVEGRGKSAQEYIAKSLKKAKSSVVNDANFVVKETTPTEDWDGFKKEVEGSSVQDKELILRVLSMYSDPEVREREIKNISEAYTQLKDDILPQLRRSVIKANYQSKVKTDEQLLALASNPDTLKVKELLYTATLTEDLAVKESLYKAAISKNNECYIANNNLGVVYAAQDKMDDAKAAFERSNEIKANNAPVLANLGAVALTNGNIEEAAKYFADAKAAGCTSPDLGYNLGVINIKEGKYSEAIQNFGGTNSFNKALAQTLAKDNAGAESTLNAMGENDNGWFYYLKAIVAAKQGKDDAVFSNLGTAISKSSDVKAYAEGDREFLKYFENETFKALFQ